jgi:hypothetical protein
MAGVSLTDRDELLFQMIYAFDGILTERHARQLVFRGISDRTWWDRLKKLVDARYLARPESEERYQVPDPVIWLDVLGIQTIANKEGVRLDEKMWQAAQGKVSGKKPLQAQLREEGIRYYARPGLRNLAHHIQVCDMRVMMMQAARRVGLPYFRWVSEGEFRLNPDRVMVCHRDDGRDEQEEKVVIPDGFCAVAKDPRNTFAYLVEVDMSTQDKPRLLHRHIRPYAAYLESEAYRARFGIRFGRVLFITTGETRVRNLKRVTEGAVDRRYFYFSHFDALNPANFFTGPVWLQNGIEEPVALVR